MGAQILTLDQPRTPPADVEAERAILAALLFAPDEIDRAACHLRPGDFHDPAHGEVMGALCELAINSAPVDAITLCDELRRRGKLDAVGGLVFVGSLIGDGCTATALGYHCAIVKRHAITRRLLYASTELAAKAYDETEPLGVEHARTMLATVVKRCAAETPGERFRPLSDLSRSVIQREIDREEGRINPIKTGYRLIDETIGLNDGGGILPGSLGIIAGRPGRGKSTFALDVALGAVEKSRAHVVIFSLEMTAEQVAKKALMREVTKEDFGRLAMGAITQSEALTKAQGAAVDKGTLTHVHVCDATQQTIEDVLSGCEEMRIKLEGEGRPMLFILDFLQRVVLTCDPSLARLGYGEISSKLADFAKDKQVAVIALSQLTRAAEKGRPSMASLRESGSIEQDASWILALDRQSDEHHDALDLYLLKNRHGPLDPWCSQIIARWQSQRFEDTDRTGPWEFDTGGAPLGR